MSSTKEIQVGDITIGGKNFVIVAGPCSIESYAMLQDVALSVKSAGASILRGGIYKIRTSPDSFQGLGNEAIDYVDKVKKEVEMPFIAEVTDISQIQDLYETIDAFQVGTRNMHNSYLLKELGKTNKPVILKRGMSAYLKEWLLAAEYVASGGNDQIILCERGIRSFDKETRNLLDLGGAVWAKQRTHYPVIVDPSHGTGVPELITPMSNATAACGLDGIMVEVHPNPSSALSDGFQALSYERFEELTAGLKKLLPCIGRELQI